MYTYKLSNLEKNLFDAMSKWEIIDCHEHLPSEKDRLNKKVDVFTLFSHYTYRDLIMAGMTEEQYLSLFNQDISLDIRWKMFAPYWKKIRWTSYSKAVLISTEKFYGFSDVNESTYKPISEAIKKANKPGIYEKVLRKACNIKTCLNQGIYWDDKRNNIEKIDPASTDLLTTVLRMPLRNRIEIDILRPSFDPDLVINSVDCYLDACRKYILKKKSEGAVGLKMMSHPYEIPNRQEAISIFKKIKAGSMNKIPPQPPHFIGTNSLRDYIIDELIRFAGEQNLVIAVHTGYW